MSSQRRGTSLYAWIYETAFASWLPPYPASLAFAIAWATVWFSLLAWMHQRGLVIKI